MPRTRPDRCPGVLSVHPAADGGLARIRLPGGTLSAAQLAALMTAAVELGDGGLELTSRANVQLRALRPGSEHELSDRLYDAGLLPSLSHERVRNLVASPRTGLDTLTVYDVGPLVAEVDRRLQDSPALADLPGRPTTTLAWLDLPTGVGNSGYPRIRLPRSPMTCRARPSGCGAGRTVPRPPRSAYDSGDSARSKRRPSTWICA